jgi:5-methylcytosine-specific restriction protein A
VVTNSAVRGYYVVYLFAADMRRVYLCLGQGTTVVREEFGETTLEELRRRAALMQARLPEGVGRFTGGQVSLKGSSRLARDYEPATAWHAGYDPAELPNEERLRDDLQEMVRLYVALTARGGRENFEDAPEPPGQGETESIIERRRYRLHRKIERTTKAAKLAKRVHGYVCQGCGFDFAVVYGETGADYIEAHHLTPLSELPEDVPVSQDPRKDFAVLCANCHRMVHRSGGPTTVEALRSLPGVTRLSDLIATLRQDDT